MCNYDVLTGLYDKSSFFIKVQETLKYNTNEKYQIIYLNIKNFMLINDLFGIEAGDRLLNKIGNIIKENLFPGEICGYLEADSFCVLVCDKYGRQLTDLLAQMPIYMDESRSYQVNIDMGVYEISDTALPVPTMCDRAKLALRTIKDSCIDKVAYYNEAMRTNILKEQVLFSQMQRAIEKGEIKIYLQGIYNTKSVILGAEVLVRWDHPARGIIAAGEFIGFLEENGMIVKLDQYVWRCACAQLKKWKQEGRDNLFLSVNISAKDFDVIDVCQVLTDLVAEYEVEPRNLRLEITETALMQDVERNIKIIDALRSKRFIVEIDDFGSGYSSLNMLKDIVTDVIKLDMKFLYKSRHEARSKTILIMIVSMLRKLNLGIIVEGVETEMQLSFLKEIGCDVFQGFFFMRPMSLEAFEKALK